MKYYAVKRGRQAGIYETWADCSEQIYKYSGAVFKSFKDLEAAEAYMQQEDTTQQINEDLPFAYIDGSYSKKNSIYSYGGFINNAGSVHIIQGTGNNSRYIAERNIAGEIIGAVQVLFLAKKLQIRELNIYYDYAGISNWLDGSWKTKTALSLYYRQTADLMSEYITAHYIKVAGHTGIKGNEIADYLAKEAAGAKLRKKDIETLKNFREAAAAMA